MSTRALAPRFIVLSRLHESSLAGASRPPAIGEDPDLTLTITLSRSRTISLGIGPVGAVMLRDLRCRLAMSAPGGTATTQG